VCIELKCTCGTIGSTKQNKKGHRLAAPI